MYQIKRNNKVITFAGDYGRMYSNCFSENKFYEDDFLSYIENLNIKGDYIDIGGNVGNHTLFFAYFCPADMIHTFEPISKYQKYIQQNIIANNLGKKIMLHEFGLSNSAEPISFEMGGGTQTIDNLIVLDESRIDFRKIGLMKIDVEGREFKVLDGAIQTIEKHKPRIFVEIVEESNLIHIDQMLLKVGYQRSSNVFNASPTYEYFAV